jgi:hypothetical protein
MSGSATAETETTMDYDGRVTAWWWLSFADDDGFRGVCIVEAMDMIAAVKLTHALGINPGGEVRGAPFPDRAGPPPERFRARILTKQQADAASRAWVGTGIVQWPSPD